MISLPKGQLGQAVSKFVTKGTPACVTIPSKAFIDKEKPVVVPKHELKVYSYSQGLAGSRLRAAIPLYGATQVRYAHTDLPMPDYSYYRREEVAKPNAFHRDSEARRKAPGYLVTVGNIAMATYVAKHTILGLIEYVGPNAGSYALSTIEIKLSDIPEGKSAIFKWRGKPVFVKHRTDEEIEREESTPLSQLRDPQADSDRVVDPKFLVVIGVCTHLGCIPIANAGDYPGGYYCPCHGSHYDGSGRIRKGPAPENLEVPPVAIDDDVLTVG